MDVKAWREIVIIPTYNAGKPEPIPMFMEKRVYQGSSGKVYPFPVIEKIADEKKDNTYVAVFLENEYLKIMILPELGGRIQRAYDKIRNRDFVYYNQVIKPALVGLAGPWISGGIEFNWPQHHRPSTFSPVDYTIENSANGSITVWVNEIELMSGTKGMAGFTLYPGKAFLEIKGRLFNRTPFPQTFLWWANPAVKVNDHYRSVFPPDVNAVFDHGKRDVSDFPIATGTYYKVDYSPGTDISRYKNIPVPTSYMAVQSKYDFIGCYEEDTEAGMLHIADHHVAPGKKQWTWGNGDFGYAWDRNLTDKDGPYIELMAGVFTDNQPDFSWLQPNESKSFEQYFLPYAQLPNVCNATKEAIIDMTFAGNSLEIRVYVTAVYENTRIAVFKKDQLVKEWRRSISPTNILKERVTDIDPATIHEVYCLVEDEKGNILVSYRSEQSRRDEIPQPAEAALPPEKIEHIEDLYLTGLHLEQYRHATYDPMAYYKEGIRRNRNDIRCNNALGLALLRRGQFVEAENYFRTAIATLTERNPNPYDGEPFYHLGLSLLYQGRNEEAYTALFKATWNDAMQHSAFLLLARIAVLQGRSKNAIELAEKALVRNYNSLTVRHLLSMLLRRTMQRDKALEMAQKSLAIDPFNVGCLFEQYLLLLDNDEKQAAGMKLLEMNRVMRRSLNNYLELSLDYARAGFFGEAIKLLKIFKSEERTNNAAVYYYLGWFSSSLGNNEGAIRYYKQAATKTSTCWFPNKLEEILILQDAISQNSKDYFASYLLGNLWYDKKQFASAIDSWERSVKLNDNFFITQRNLALAYYNKAGRPDAAVDKMEKAFVLAPGNARILMELDQLYRITGKSLNERLNVLENHLRLTEERDDLYLERIVLYNLLGEFKKALELLSKRKFHPWEGGEGKVTRQYLYANLELAKQALRDNQFKEAFTWLNATKTFPANLGEGILGTSQSNDIDYLLGCAYEGLQMQAEAKKHFHYATVGQMEPVQAIYYNDPQPDKIVYQALAWIKLNDIEKAVHLFNNLIQFGEDHYHDEISIDYFAVSLPDMLVFDVDLNKRNKIHCKYLMGLGYLGLGKFDKAGKLLQEVLAMENAHAGAIAFLEMQPFFMSLSRVHQ